VTSDQVSGIVTFGTDAGVIRRNEDPTGVNRNAKRMRVSLLDGDSNTISPVPYIQFVRTGGGGTEVELTGLRGAKGDPGDMGAQGLPGQAIINGTPPDYDGQTVYYPRDVVRHEGLLYMRSPDSAMTEVPDGSFVETSVATGNAQYTGTTPVHVQLAVGNNLTSIPLNSVFGDILGGAGLALYRVGFDDAPLPATPDCLCLRYGYYLKDLQVPVRAGSSTSPETRYYFPLEREATFDAQSNVLTLYFGRVDQGASVLFSSDVMTGSGVAFGLSFTSADGTALGGAWYPENAAAGNSVSYNYQGITHQYYFRFPEPFPPSEITTPATTDPNIPGDTNAQWILLAPRGEPGVGFDTETTLHLEYLDSDSPEEPYVEHDAGENKVTYYIHRPVAGAQGEQGVSGIANVGSWSAGVTYQKGDVAVTNASTYIALSTSLGVDPTEACAMGPDEGGRWALLVRQGNQGIRGVPGLKGDLGPEGPQGEAGLRSVGQFDNEVLYERGDIVTTLEDTYIALRQSMGHDPYADVLYPAEHGDEGPHWALLMRRGPKGNPGDTGPEGAKGPAGSQGNPGIAGTSAPTILAGSICWNDLEDKVVLTSGTSNGGPTITHTFYLKRDALVNQAAADATEAKNEVNGIRDGSISLQSQYATRALFDPVKTYTDLLRLGTGTSQTGKLQPYATDANALGTSVLATSQVSAEFAKQAKLTAFNALGAVVNSTTSGLATKASTTSVTTLTNTVKQMYDPTDTSVNGLPKTQFVYASQVGPHAGALVVPRSNFDSIMGFSMTNQSVASLSQYSIPSIGAWLQEAALTSKGQRIHVGVVGPSDAGASQGSVEIISTRSGGAVFFNFRTNGFWFSTGTTARASAEIKMGTPGATQSAYHTEFAAQVKAGTIAGRKFSALLYFDRTPTTGATPSSAVEALVFTMDYFTGQMLLTVPQVQGATTALTLPANATYTLRTDQTISTVVPPV